VLVKILIIIALCMLAASFIVESHDCAPGNGHRPGDITTCGCATDTECELGQRHEGDEP
jgi:hypothetical protein